MRKIIVLVFAFLLVTPILAINNSNYCGRFSSNPGCYCREGEEKITVWYAPPPDCTYLNGKLVCKYYVMGFGYAYCEREGMEEKDARIANNIWRALNK